METIRAKTSHRPQVVIRSGCVAERTGRIELTWQWRHYRRLFSADRGQMPVLHQPSERVDALQLSTKKLLPLQTMMAWCTWLFTSNSVALETVQISPSTSRCCWARHARLQGWAVRGEARLQDGGRLDHEAEAVAVLVRLHGREYRQERPAVT